MTDETKSSTRTEQLTTVAQSPAPRRPWFALRQPPTTVQSWFFGILCLATVLALWWFVTRGEGSERILGYFTLPSPRETFESFHSLWFDRELSINMMVSLRRVMLGFGLAVLVGVPLGVLCGCFSWIGAFFAPLTLFGRNVPIAALVPLTFALFGIGESQKIMFIFLACVAFIIADTAGAIADISSSYVDTAYTLGANKRQIILKVLFPLALPAIFNSMRLLFGLAFGYIMLAEMIKFGGESGGLGDIINVSEKRGNHEHILLVIMIIPLVALALDRLFFWIQQELFPHRYGGYGILRQAVRLFFRAWESVTGIFRKPVALPGAFPVAADAKAKGDAP
jgi:ABC-type nitrate/sulfonate/bicarbonate transport system permease component